MKLLALEILTFSFKAFTLPSKTYIQTHNIFWKREVKWSRQMPMQGKIRQCIAMESRSKQDRQNSIQVLDDISHHKHNIHIHVCASNSRTPLKGIFLTTYLHQNICHCIFLHQILESISEREFRSAMESKSDEQESKVIYLTTHVFASNSRTYLRANKVAEWKPDPVI